MNRNLIHNTVTRFRESSDASDGFNITPVIDIVFLLIIFFLLVCRFIETQPDEVDLPEGIDSAESLEDGVSPVVVTMTESKNNPEAYINGELFSLNGDDSAASACAKINSLVETAQPNRKVVTLKIDKAVTCRNFKHILKVVAESSIEDIRLVVIKEDR
jgi:biopolymer transport protein ExbD